MRLSFNGKVIDVVLDEAMAVLKKVEDNTATMIDFNELSELLQACRYDNNGEAIMFDEKLANALSRYAPNEFTYPFELNSDEDWHLIQSYLKQPLGVYQKGKRTYTTVDGDGQLLCIEYFDGVIVGVYPTTLDKNLLKDQQDDDLPPDVFVQLLDTLEHNKILACYYPQMFEVVFFRYQDKLCKAYFIYESEELLLDYVVFSELDELLDFVDNNYTTFVDNHFLKAQNDLMVAVKLGDKAVIERLNELNKNPLITFDDDENTFAIVQDWREGKEFLVLQLLPNGEIDRVREAKWENVVAMMNWITSISHYQQDFLEALDKELMFSLKDLTLL